MPLLKYEQIAESLRARIADSEFEPGELLPSGRDLSEQWGVSRATVVKAMDVLRNDGLVVARQGAGSPWPKRRWHAPPVSAASVAVRSSRTWPRRSPGAPPARTTSSTAGP